MAGAHDVLVDRDLGVGVGHLDLDLDERRPVVGVGERELVRRGVEHVALGGLGLDKRVGGGAVAQVELIGGRGAVLASGHVVDDLALGGAHGAVGAHDVLHGDDVELRAGELARAALVMHMALIGAVRGAAALGHGGAALRLLVRVGDDRGGDRVLMVA